jgi:hypothetical protein
MPVRSSSSPVLRWPDRAAVVSQAARWAAEQAAFRPALLRLGYFGSYARGDWGVGSDLDLLAIVRSSSRTFIERAREWPTEELPVPADLLVYTVEEWKRLTADTGGFARSLAQEVVWLVDREQA